VGADITVRRPKGLNLALFRALCVAVPIDVEVKRAWIHFHYGYWGPRHEAACEDFVARFMKRHRLPKARWNY
jgi:hypothetical protein